MIQTKPGDLMKFMNLDSKNRKPWHFNLILALLFVMIISSLKLFHKNNAAEELLKSSQPQNIIETQYAWLSLGKKIAFSFSESDMPFFLNKYFSKDLVKYFNEHSLKLNQQKDHFISIKSIYLSSSSLNLFFNVSISNNASPSTVLTYVQMKISDNLDYTLNELGRIIFESQSIPAKELFQDDKTVIVPKMGLIVLSTKCEKPNLTLKNDFELIKTISSSEGTEFFLKSNFKNDEINISWSCTSRNKPTSYYVIKMTAEEFVEAAWINGDYAALTSPKPLQKKSNKSEYQILLERSLNN